VTHDRRCFRSFGCSFGPFLPNYLAHHGALARSDTPGLEEVHGGEAGFVIARHLDWQRGPRAFLLVQELIDSIQYVVEMVIAVGDVLPDPLGIGFRYESCSELLGAHEAARIGEELSAVGL